ncbi:MAG: glycogen/starch/alpha-glucan phosphorylase [Lachnospiraceae bacterium]|nr:glycogen/starch/alpha-glucan phosphorylase [Lachnospiraceae bacterium]
MASKKTIEETSKPSAKKTAEKTVKTETKKTADKSAAKKADTKTTKTAAKKADTKATKTTAKKADTKATKTTAKKADTKSAKAPAKKADTKAVKTTAKKTETKVSKPAVKKTVHKRPIVKFRKDLFKRSVVYNVKTLYRKSMEEATPQQIFQAVSYAIKDQVVDYWLETQEAYEKQDPKTVYYLSMEFLMGRALGNNMINLCAYKEAKEALEELGVDINVIEDQEPDAALGNGGLGRLAACFLDSLATLGYSAYGCGIRYRYGMFKQEIRDGYQVEAPDNWLENGNPFELRRPEYTKEVRFGGYVSARVDENGRYNYFQEGYQAVKAVPYDVPIVGYGNGIVNTLRIWDAQPIDCFRLDSFDKGDYQKAVEQENLARNIVEVLYPNDNHYAGKELRLKQQYFFISASVQEAIAKYMRNHDNVRNLHEKVTFQLNDTHPTVAIAEIMRILMDEYYLTWDEAWDVTTKCCAYTNHTIMAEALEKWPIELFSRLLPRIYQIVEEINRRFIHEIESKYPGNQDKVRKMAIIYDGQVKMAHLAIVAGYSVNGVARLHTEILKNQELKDFYEMFPEKFNNKTNGITQRRFLLHGNPLLADWVTDHIGDEWITDLPQISKLKVYASDKKAQAQFMNIKYQNKVRLAKYIKEHNGIDVDPRSIFDVQVKRLHEYKRQLLNILHVMYLYNELKEHPDMEFYPRTFIFGAKAAAGYRNAKLTIKLINSVADVINNDKSIDGKIKVVFIENYSVSNAEFIFAASDVSEQISTASKEASGTGNMKFMLNGAVTIGTMDGANVEIVEEVGEENAFIFGLSSDEVINFENNGGYDPMEIFNNDPDVRKVLMQLINGTYSKDDTERFRHLYNSLLNTQSTSKADTYFILKDFKAYAAAQRKVEQAYMDERGWAEKAIMNVACSGKFTSDRTIKQYVDEIWKLDKVTL